MPGKQPELLTKRQYAESRGISTQTLDYRIKIGVVTVRIRDDGAHVLDPVVADEQWRSHIGEKNLAEGPTSEQNAALRNVRLARETAQANLYQLNVLKKKGVLVNKEVIGIELVNIARTIRNSMLSVADRISGEIAAMSGIDPAVVHKIITEEHRKGLEILANGLRDNPT